MNMDMSPFCIYKTKATISRYAPSSKVQVGNDQEKAQSERNSHSKNRNGEKMN